MQSDDARSVPGSLVEVATLMPALMALAGASTMLIGLVGARFSSPGEFLIVFAGLAPATLMTTLGVHFLARQRVGSAIGAMLAVAALHALLGVAVAHELGAFVTPFVDGITLVLASPALVIAKFMGARRERDAGDTALLWGAVWSLGVHGLYVLTLARSDAGLPLAVACVGLFISFFAIGAAVARAENRRAFTRLALRGKIAGFRVRLDVTPSEVAGLPLLFEKKPGVAAGVLERLAIDSDGSPYRGGLVASPVALVPLV